MSDIKYRENKLGRYLDGVNPVVPSKSELRPWETALEDKSYLEVTTEKSYRRGKCIWCSKPYKRLEDVIVDRRNNTVGIYHVKCYSA